MANDQETYFVIFGSEDGGCSIKRMSKEEILKMLVPNKWGDFDYGKREVLFDLPDDICNFTDMVIIKGRIVVPTAKEVVKEYDLP